MPIVPRNGRNAVPSTINKVIHMTRRDELFHKGTSVSTRVMVAPPKLVPEIKHMKLTQFPALATSLVMHTKTHEVGIL